MNNIKYFTLYLIASFILMTGCSEFLDLKPDQKMTVPTSLEDCEALLDDRGTMNSLFPIAGELGSDNYYLPDLNWSALTTPADLDGYTWSSNTDLNFQNWQAPYKVNLIANQVLDLLGNLLEKDDAPRYNRLK